MMILYIPIAVVLVCFIVYALDRRSKQEPIDWFTAGKLSFFGGLMSSGIIFALSGNTEAIQTVIETIKTEVPVAQEMFVGVPTF
jgi:hypothetical protein